MVTDHLTDGVRIGQLLASEITGDEGRLRSLRLTDVDPDVEPTPDGALAYHVSRAARDGSELVAEAYVQPDRVRLEFVTAPDAVAEAASKVGLRVRPKGVRPPRTLVFVEDGAQVKRALTAFEAALASRE